MGTSARQARQRPALSPKTLVFLSEGRIPYTAENVNAELGLSTGTQSDTRDTDVHP